MRRKAAQAHGQRKSGASPIAGQAMRPDAAWEPLRVRSEERPGAVVLYPAGEVDIATVSRLSSMLNAAGEGGRHVIVALGGITYIDSMGIKALLDAHRRLQPRSQRLVLAEAPAVLRKIIEITALEKVIPVYASLDQAVASLDVPAGAPAPRAGA